MTNTKHERNSSQVIAARAMTRIVEGGQERELEPMHWHLTWGQDRWALCGIMQVPDVPTLISETEAWRQVLVTLAGEPDQLVDPARYGFALAYWRDCNGVGIVVAAMPDDTIASSEAA